MNTPGQPSAPEAAATGLLSEKPLAHLLAYARDRKLSGTFVLENESGQRARIVLRAGKLAHAWTSEPIVYLGHVLFETGVIDGSQLSASLAEVVATKSLHGQVLLASRMIDAAQLSSALHQQRSRKLHHVFTFPGSSSFAFFSDVDLVGDRPNGAEPVDLLPSIWRGVAAYPSWEHVRSTVAKVAAYPVRLVGALDASSFRSAEGEAVLSLRHAPATVAELATRPDVSLQAAELLVYFLVINRLAAVESAPEAPLSAEPPRPKVSVPESSDYVRRVSFTMRAINVKDVPDPGVAEATAQPPLARPRTDPGLSRPRTDPGLSRPRTDPGLSRPATNPGLSRPATNPGLSRPRTDPGTFDRAAAAAMENSPEAEIAFKQAEMLFVLGERGDALRVVRAALTIAPRMASALVLLLTIEAANLDDVEQDRLRDIARRLDAVIAANRTCKRGRFRRGQIRRRIGDIDGAIDDFRAAIASDPNDLEAQQELKLCDRRGREPPASLLDRLRGR